MLRCFAAGLAIMSMQAPASAERTVASFIDAHNGEALALLEKVVNVNSGSLNLDGVRAVGAMFRAEFDALGFVTRWVDGAAFKRAGHLIADHQGRGPRILLIGFVAFVMSRGPAVWRAPSRSRVHS